MLQADSASNGLQWRADTCSDSPPRRASESMPVPAASRQMARSVSGGISTRTSLTTDQLKPQPRVISVSRTRPNRDSLERSTMPSIRAASAGRHRTWCLSGALVLAARAGVAALGELDPRDHALVDLVGAVGEPQD